MYQDRRVAGEHIVRVERLRRTWQRHGTDHDPELRGVNFTGRQALMNVDVASSRDSNVGAYARTATPLFRG